MNAYEKLMELAAKVNASEDIGWVHGVITITHEDGNVETGEYV